MSNTADLDVVGIGNAIVDILSFCEDDFLAHNELNKGSMCLVDWQRSKALYEQSGQSEECSGGSVANSLAGLASLGGKTGFIGKVADDQLGKIFTHDMRAIGVEFTTPPTQENISTANCLVFVTPDAQRTMATYLGACSNVSEADIDPELIQRGAVTYVEGYLWDTEHAKQAIRKAITTAHDAGRKVAFTLSDTFCVDRHRAEFLELVEHHIDILFANEEELKSLFEVDTLEAALDKLQAVCTVAAVTRSEKGCVIVTAQDRITVPAEKVKKVVDTTGAGDLFAGGFLFAYTRGQGLKECGALGNRCAGTIISQLGARSLTPLDTLVA